MTPIQGDPFEEYQRKHGTRASSGRASGAGPTGTTAVSDPDPFETYRQRHGAASVAPPEERPARSVGEVLASGGRHLAAGASEFAESVGIGLARLPGVRNIDMENTDRDDPLWREAMTRAGLNPDAPTVSPEDAMRTSREMVRARAGDPTTGVETGLRIAGELGGTGVGYGMAGKALRWGVGKVAPFLGRLRGAAQTIASPRSRLAEAASDVATGAPIDIALSVGDPESSLANTLTVLSQTEGGRRQFFRSILESPVKRAALEVAFGTVATGVVHGIGAAPSTARRLAGPSIEDNVAAGIREGTTVPRGEVPPRTPETPQGVTDAPPRPVEPEAPLRPPEEPVEAVAPPEALPETSTMGDTGARSSGEYEIVEKDNPLAVHGIFDSIERAERHLAETIPNYVARGYFTDKTLRPESFIVRPRAKQKGRSGTADPTLLAGVARAGTGALTGAALDEENRLRGAAVGAGVALAGPSALRGMRRMDEVGAVGLRGPDDLPMDEASRLARAREQGFDVDAYHGAGRPDRVGDAFDPARATSGPMPFFTDDPAVASRYAEGKLDTSRQAEGMDYEAWYKIKGDDGVERGIGDAWSHLSLKERVALRKNLGRVTEDEDTGKLVFGEGPGGQRHWEYELRQAKGNPLAAARSVWLESGNLFNEEHQFEDVLKLAGLNSDRIRYDDPNASQPGVFPVKIRPGKAFSTDDPKALRALVTELEKVDTGPRTELRRGVDHWDKEDQGVREFLVRLRDDIERGTSFAWTTIPDEVTNVLRGMGYESVRDTGGKMGGQSHAVTIPFSTEQVRSRFARFDPANIGKPGLSGFTTPGVAGALARTGVGAGIGAAVDEESPGRGALLGGAAMLGAPSVVRRLAGSKGGPPAYLASPAVRRVLGTVGSSGQPAGVLSRLSTTTGDGLRKLYTRIVDEAEPLKAVGRKLEGTESLSHEVSRAAGYRGAALQYLRENLGPVVQKAVGNEAGVNALTKAERALELLDAGLEKTDIPREVLEQTVRELRAIPEVAAAADELRAYYRSLLDRKLREGVISPEQYEAITKSGQAYIPFVREVEEGLEGGTAQFTADGRLKSGSTGVRKMDEGKASSATVDPFRQAIEDTLETERRVGKQRVTNMLSAIVDADPDSAEALGLRFVDDATAGQRGARVTPVNVNGQRRWLEVADDEIWNAFAAFDPYVGNIFVRVLSAPKKWLREGVTALPDFGVANAIRDNVMSGIQVAGTKEAVGGLVGAGVGAATAEEGERLEGALTGLGIGALSPHIARTLAAMRDVVGNSVDYQEWIREGGSGFGFYPRDKKGADRVLAELRRTGVSPSDIVSPRKWWDTLQAFNRTLEEATRVARYKQLKGQGRRTPEAVAGSRDISLDFARTGKHMNGVAAITAFFNAQVQGWDKLARLLKNPKTWGVGGAMITAPSVGLWLANKDNPEYWDRPAWERNMFWLIPKAEGGGFWRIPKPFEIGFIFASVPERLLDYAYTKNPEALKVALKDLASNYGASALLPIPTGAEPIIENITDHSLFRNRPINPHQFEQLPPEMQYDARTSYPAVAIGRLTGTSPAKVENLIRGLGGSLAGEVLEQSTRLARATGVDERPTPAETARPLVGRFETRETNMGEREVALRRRLSEVERTRNAYRQMIQNGETEKAQRYVDEHMDELREYETLRGVATTLDTARHQRRQIELSDLPPEQKRAQIREINARIATLSGEVTQALSGRRLLGMGAAGP